MLASSCREDLFIPGNCLAASAGPGAEPQGGIPHEHPRKPSPYVNIRTSNRVITLSDELPMDIDVWPLHDHAPLH
jgi:hypothetical protein